MVWLDGLDIPIVRFLGASFAEPGQRREPDRGRPAGDALARYGANMLPVDFRPRGLSSPVFSYPYARSREALAALARAGAPDACHGHKMRYVNPATGDHAMPTIGAFLQLLPAGFDTDDYRATDGTIYVAVEGEGRTMVGDTVIAWKPRDIFVVPGWHRHRHLATSEAVLFSFSDRPVQEKLGLWREERG